MELMYLLTGTVTDRSNHNNRRVDGSGQPATSMRQHMIAALHYRSPDKCMTEIIPVRTLVTKVEFITRRRVSDSQLPDGKTSTTWKLGT